VAEHGAEPRHHDCRWASRVTIVDGLQESGQPTLHVAFSTDTPPWILIGLLESALQDVRQAWEHGMFDPHEAELDEDC
jgi:hypothetical protein